MIDAYASHPWYADHLRPIFDALGDQAGTFHTAAGPQRGRAALAAGHSPIITVAIGDHSTARRLGRRMLCLGQHGAGQGYMIDGKPLPNSSYPGGARQDDVGLFLVPNATAERMTRWRYPRARIEVVGCPKLDVLPHRISDGTKDIVAISTHWPGRHVPEAGNAWHTFRRALLALAGQYTVLGHAHPRIMAQLASAYRQAGIEVVPSFDDVLRRADLYVCDNSSSLFEFAATGRPVVVLNAPQYRHHVEHGLRFWEAACVGVNVDRPADLADAVARALALWPADVAAREAALDLVYQPRTGGAALAAAALRDWA